MATSSSSPEAPASHSSGNSITMKHIADASHVTYQNAQLTWNGGKLGDQDIIMVTSIDSGENGHIIWSLAPTDNASSSKQTHFELQSTSATSLPLDFLERYLFNSLPDPLGPETHSIHVIISTRSGTGLALDFFNELLHPVLRAIGLAESRYNIVQTENAESVKEFARSILLDNANKGRKQTVLMLSGDGGIVDSINGLLESGDQPRYF
jgi:hypothetical protein